MTEWEERRARSWVVTAPFSGMGEAVRAGLGVGRGVLGVVGRCGGGRGWW